MTEEGVELSRGHGEVLIEYVALRDGFALAVVVLSSMEVGHLLFYYSLF